MRKDVSHSFNFERAIVCDTQSKRQDYLEVGKAGRLAVVVKNLLDILITRQSWRE
jgi:hypothetical protein